MKNLFFPALLLIITSCSIQRNSLSDISSAKLVKVWESDSTLKVPESVLVDKSRKWDPLESTCRHASLSIL